MVAACVFTAAAAGSASFYSAPFERHPNAAALTVLGRALFSDKALSASGRMSCASCHDPARAYGPPDGASVQRGGVDGRRAGVRAVPSLRYQQDTQPFSEHFSETDGNDSADQGPVGGRTWDGRASSAHEQAVLPLLSPFEMANASRDAVVARLRASPSAARFRDTFGPHVLDDPELSWTGLLWALEVFQQSPEDFYPYSSKYDAVLRGKATLNAREQRGLELFNDATKGNCAACHVSTIRHGAFPQFSDRGLIALGVPRNRSLPINADPRYHDLGLCGPWRTDLTKRAEYCGLFKTPTLRNVATRRVFFHNGVYHRLEDVLAFYAERDVAPRKFYPRDRSGRIRIFDDMPAALRGQRQRGAAVRRPSGSSRVALRARAGRHHRVPRRAHRRLAGALTLQQRGPDLRPLGASLTSAFIAPSLPWLRHADSSDIVWSWRIPIVPRSFRHSVGASMPASVSSRVSAIIAVVASVLTTIAFADQDREDHGRDEPYAIGLWGDLPYSDVQAQVGVPNLIADMNRHELAFTVHDGDLKAGNGTAGSATPTTCSDALYVQALGFFNALRAPAIFTPGDNDWTDCDRPSNGGFSSRERLDHERQVFFSTPFSLGQRKLHQDVQTAKLCLDANNQATACVENRRWTYGGVTYVTLNVQGSCNNLCDTAPDPAEWTARNAANIAWLRESFQFAAARQSVAVMIISQADPGWDLSDGTRAPLRDPNTLAETDGQPDGFQDYLGALRDEVIKFRRPVAYVHGDSHYHRIDKPFLDTQGRRLENFTRVETFGDNQANGTNDVNWVRVTVDPRSRDVFSYQAKIVPANRTAVPSPQ